MTNRLWNAGVFMLFIGVLLAIGLSVTALFLNARALERMDAIYSATTRPIIKLSYMAGDGEIRMTNIGPGPAIITSITVATKNNKNQRVWLNFPSDNNNLSLHEFLGVIGINQGETANNFFLTGWPGIGATYGNGEYLSLFIAPAIARKSQAWRNRFEAPLRRATSRVTEFCIRYDSLDGIPYESSGTGLCDQHPVQGDMLYLGQKDNAGLYQPVTGS